MPKKLTGHARLLAAEEDPTGRWLIYGADTPNTHKPAMLLEELGVDYAIKTVNIAADEQKKPWCRGAPTRG